jgi:hypothetical protein
MWAGKTQILGRVSEARLIHINRARRNQGVVTLSVTSGARPGLGRGVRGRGRALNIW